MDDSETWMGRRAAMAPGALRARLALYAGAGVLLFLVERLVPNPLPWVRLGLANTVTLVVLVEHGAAAASVVLALRLLLGGFFAGTLFGPQFVLGTSGGLASLLVMGLALRVGRRIWSPLGLSVMGSSVHAATQLVVVAAVFAAGRGVLGFLPLFLGVALVTGTLTGLVADVLLARLELSRAGAAAWRVRAP